MSLAKLAKLARATQDITTPKKKKNKKKTPPPKPATQRGTGEKPSIFASRFNISEGARADDVTGGSVNIARDVGTRGENVTTGAGSRAQGYVAEEAGGRIGARRAERYLALKEKVDDGTATKVERLAFMKLAKQDTDAFVAQQGRTLASRQRKSDAAKLSAKQREDALEKFYNTGEIVEGFEPTPNQVKIATRNAERRKALAAGEDETAEITAAMREANAARTQPPARKPLSGIRAEDVGGMKDGGLTRRQTKAKKAYAKYQETVKDREKAARKRKSAKRKNITASMPAARGGLMKTGHKDYRKGGMFYVGGTSAKVTPINKGKK